MSNTSSSASSSTASPAVTAVLLISSHCPHCAQLLSELTELVKQGELGELQIINLEQQPEAAQHYGTRSVPWLSIGPYVLNGLQNRAALQQRIAWVRQGQRLRGHFDTLLSTGRAEQVVATIRQDSDSLQAILGLLGDPATVLSTRIGIGVVMESLLETAEGTALLRAQLPQLGQLSSHADARIRADACHYLALSGDPAARDWLQAALNDPDPEVREVAQDGLAELTD
ncbi:MAG: HEAT repeat domain-containing protein [Thiolinea sp.]